MTRISLKEAYDNRDVIAQIVRLRDEVDELINILKDIDPNGDLTNVVTKTGDQTIDGVKTFIGEIVANCDIIQNGAAYETHAEQVFSKNDYLVMRDEAVSALPAGSYSGLQVKKYDGTQDCRLVIDNQGVARVGDINDEQPLATRDEVANMTSGALVKWDGVNKKLITSGASVGSDTQPVKIVNGAPVAVAAALQTALSNVTTTPSANVSVIQYGHVVQASVYAQAVTPGTPVTVSGLPKALQYSNSVLCSFGGTGWTGIVEIEAGSTILRINSTTLTPVYGSLTYITE